MALPALKDVYETLDAAPALPSMAAEPNQDFRRYIAGITDRFERDVQRWRFEIGSQLRALERSAREYVEAGADPRAVAEDLRGLQDHLGAGIEARYAVLESFRAIVDEAEATIARASMQDAKFFRKQTRRYVDLVEKEIEARENFRLALTLLRADLDPDARGGPVFDSAAAVIERLRAPTGT
jgi:hypothetical protein